MRIAALALLALPSIAAAQDCEVEHIKGSMKGTSVPYIQGVATCQSGRISYQLFDKESGDFVASGFHYFDGFVFGIYPDANIIPADFDFRYVIEPR